MCLFNLAGEGNLIEPGPLSRFYIPGPYAPWRASHLNVSARKMGSEEAGELRHLGWEQDDAEVFSSETGANGLLWERFTARHQAEDMIDAWPDVVYEPEP